MVANVFDAEAGNYRPELKFGIKTNQENFNTIRNKSNQMLAIIGNMMLVKYAFRFFRMCSMNCKIDIISEA